MNLWSLCGHCGLCPAQCCSHGHCWGQPVSGEELGTVKAADTVTCWAELSRLCFALDAGVAWFVIFSSTLVSSRNSLWIVLIFVSFSTDLEAREREAQTHESEEEEIRTTRTLEQEVTINLEISLLLLQRTAESLYHHNKNPTMRCSRLCLALVQGVGSMGSRKGGPWKGSHSTLAGVSPGLFFVCPLPLAEQAVTAASWLYAG